MTFLNVLQILLLAVVQGLAELLPVSSSAHVTVMARLIGFDISSGEQAEIRWAFLLIMLHTGTMFAVLLYFWSRWKPLLKQIPALAIATAVTGVVGLGLVKLIERVFLYDAAAANPHEIEHLFHNFPLIACSLAAAGGLIVVSGWKDTAKPATGETIGAVQGGLIGFVQGLCLPFRGFSRSGATISTSMMLGIARMRAEEFSFALAVILTPAVIGYEGAQAAKTACRVGDLIAVDPASFGAGIVGHGGQFRRRAGRAAMAVAMAGKRPLDLLRLLLSDVRRDCAHHSLFDVGELTLRAKRQRGRCGGMTIRKKSSA